MQQTLVITAGLPGSGKSTLAENLAKALGLPYLTVDPIEAALVRAGTPLEHIGAQGYDIMRALAAENLQLGHSVIVDAVNAVEEARHMWRELAKTYDVRLAIIECTCSDEGLHKRRIEQRVRGIEGLAEVTWERVIARKSLYAPWTDERLVLDSVDCESAMLAQTLDWLQA